MFAQNVYDEAPVEDILPETMEAFLDEFCLTSHGDLTNKDFKVSLSILFLESNDPFRKYLRAPSGAYLTLLNNCVCVVQSYLDLNELHTQDVLRPEYSR